MLQRQVTRTQAIIALALTAILAMCIGSTANVPAVPLPSMGITTVLGIVVLPAMVVTLAGAFRALRDPAARAAAVKRAEQDAKNYY